MKRYWTGILGQVQAFQRRFLRDKVSLFFTFLFPLIFLFVFGSIFKNQTVNFKVGIINHSHSQFAQQFVDNATKGKDSVLKVKDVKGLDDAKEKMKRSQIDGIIELPKDFGEQGPDGKPRGTIKVLYSKGSDQAGSTLTAVMNQTTNGVNKALGQPDAPIKVSSNAVGDEALSSFDYTFTGLLTFSLMSMGIFGLANTMPAEKKRGSYRRLRAAPFSPAQLIIASGIHYLVVALLSVATMFLVGTFVFHFKMRGAGLEVADGPRPPAVRGGDDRPGPDDRRLGEERESVLCADQRRRHAPHVPVGCLLPGLPLPGLAAGSHQVRAGHPDGGGLPARHDRARGLRRHRVAVRPGGALGRRRVRRGHQAVPLGVASRRAADSPRAVRMGAGPAGPAPARIGGARAP